MQTQGKQQGRSVGSTKGEQIHARGSQNPNRTSQVLQRNSECRLRVETASSGLHCCTGQLNLKSTAHTHSRTEFACWIKAQIALENITNNSLVSQALLQSPLAVFGAQIAAFQQSKFNRRKQEAPLGLFSSELWPGEPHTPAFPSPEPGSSSLGSQELKWVGLNFRTGMTRAKFHLSRGLPLRRKWHSNYHFKATRNNMVHTMECALKDMWRYQYFSALQCFHKLHWSDSGVLQWLLCGTCKVVLTQVPEYRRGKFCERTLFKGVFIPFPHPFLKLLQMT